MSTTTNMQSDPMGMGSFTSTAKSMIGILHSGGSTEVVDVKPCSPPLIYYYQSNEGWNAVLVGLLSAMLALIFMMICLYYLGRRRIEQLLMTTVDTEKGGQSAIQTTSTSQTTTAIMVNENGKEIDRTTKINSYQEQSGVGGEFIPLTNGGAGHTNLQMTNGDLGGLHQALGYGHGEGNKESETRLLSEHQ